MRSFSFQVALVVAILLGADPFWWVPSRLGLGAFEPKNAIAQNPPVQKTFEGLPAPSAFDESIEPLMPENQQSEAEQDRSLTLSLFSAGRAMELRGRASEAIRYYQRAFFYEPSSKAAVEGVVRLAKELDRKDIRFRYLVRWAELAPTELPAEVMVDLMDTPEMVVSSDRLIRVLQKLVDTREKARLRSPGDLLLYWRLAEMLAGRDDFPQAADAAVHVVQALENPESFGLRNELAEQIENQSAEALTQFADLFVDVDRTDQAERLYRQVNAREPDPLWLNLRLACVEIKRGNGEAALKLLEPVLANPPMKECFVPFAALKAAYEQLGREESLEKELQTLREKFQSHVPLLCFLGQYYLEKKEYERAKEAFLASLQLQPTRTALAGIAEIGLNSGDPSAWLGLVAREFEVCGTPMAMTEQVDRVLKDPALLDQTLQTAQRILQDTPDRLGEYGPLTAAVIALRAKRFEQLKQFLPQVEAATPEETIQLYLCWGMTLFDEGRYPEAANVFLEGLKSGAKKEEYVSLEYFLAAALEMQGETTRALEAIDRAIACEPNAARLWYQKAWILFHAKRNEESQRAFEEFLDRTEKNYDELPTRLLVAESRQVLAYLASVTGEVEKAEEQLLLVLDEFPDNVSVKNDLAFLWSKRGVDLQKSLRLAKETVQAVPDDANYHDTLGWTYFQLGQIDQATKELQRAAELDPDDEEISAHLKQVLELSQKSD